MKRDPQKKERGIFDLIEEATHVFRSAPAATLATYYVGAIPFVLGVLFFWADMSRNPFAEQHLSETSLALCFLFLWLKFWQAIFARRIRAHLTHDLPAPLTFKKGLRIFMTQAVWQPSGLFLIPLSAVPFIPLVWVYTFYQNVTTLADGETGTTEVFKKACRLAAISPRQNFLALAVLTGFAWLIFLNWGLFCLTLPSLFKMLFGVQSVFSQSPASLLNSTFFAAMFGLTYLCADPIFKIYVGLRCFYGESRESGADLRAELKPWSAVAQKMALLLALAVMLSTGSASAQDQPAVAPVAIPVVVPAGDLDHAIRETISERKFTWRMPRDRAAAPEESESALGKFFDKIGTMISRWLREFAHWIGHKLDKWFHHHPSTSYDKPSSGVAWIELEQLFVWGLVAVVIVAVVLLLFRVWQNRQQGRITVTAEPVAAMPDVTDENVRADQLPEDEWTRLARELLERGEFRLAMRAFYLASLAHLAARNLIQIARFKSNREYERELRRRGHAIPQLPGLFTENISRFEQVWYGRHAVDQQSVLTFAQNVERIKSAA